MRLYKKCVLIEYLAECPRTHISAERGACIISKCIYFKNEACIQAYACVSKDKINSESKYEPFTPKPLCKKIE